MSNDWLKKAKQTASTPKPPFVVLYGPHGCGKTSFGSEFPKSAFVYTKKECGIEDLIDLGKVPQDYPHYRADDWEAVRGITKALLESDHKRVFFDTADAMLRLLNEHICETKFDGHWEGKDGFDNWGKGMEACIPEWEGWLGDILELKAKGIAPFILCHAIPQDVRDPARDPYRQWVPDIYRSKNASSKIDLLGPLLNQATEVGFFDFEVLVTDNTTTKEGLKTVGRAVGGKRLLWFQRTAAWEAKSRAGVTCIDMGNSPTEAFKNYTSAYMAARPKAQEQK